jgi:RNA polymerase sigma-70 factor (ECF subfamily)
MADRTHGGTRPPGGQRPDTESGETRPGRRPDLAGASDHALAAAVGRGGSDALEEIYRRHSAAVHATAVRVVRVRSWADDVVQDVFTRLWHGPSRFDPVRGSLRTFLLTVAHSRAVDLLRSEIARRNREQVDIQRCVELRDGHGMDVETRCDAWEIRAALASLPILERQAITLAYIAGHSYREVARLLGVPEGTTKSRIGVGLRHLNEAVLAKHRAS